MIESSGEENNYLDLVNRQVELFKSSSLLKRLPSAILLDCEVAVTPVNSPSMYLDYAATFKDNPRTDTVTALIDEPTLDAMEEAFSGEAGLSLEEIRRLYIGRGLANLLIVSCLNGSLGNRSMRKFFDAMSMSHDLFMRVSRSPIFESAQADETANLIIHDGDRQTAKVNITRLVTGIFIETQPDSTGLQEKVEDTFQAALQEEFNDKDLYIHRAVLLGKSTSEAMYMYANNVEELMGLALPMNQDEIKETVRLLRSR